MFYIIRYSAISQKLSFGILKKKLVQPQTVKSILVQETNKLFIEEVLLKTSLMKKDMPTNINSLSNRVLSTT